MTTVEVDLRRPAQDGTDVPAKGVLECSPTARRDVEDYIVLPEAFTVRLVDGLATLDLAPTVSGTWAWRITERINRGAHRLVSVPDSVSPVTYADLPAVDPNTLDPTTPGIPAWQAYIDAQVLALIADAPGALDTLNELAAALGDDPNFATTVTNLINLKADQTDLDTLASDTAAALSAGLATKVNTSTYTAGLALKADQSAVTAALAVKADTTALTAEATARDAADQALATTISNYATSLNTALGTKADASALTTETTARRAANTDTLNIDRLDRQNTQAARTGGGNATIKQADSTETTESFADVAGIVKATNGQVSGNRFYATNATNPGGFNKVFQVATGQRFHVQTILYIKAASRAASFYFGFDMGTAGRSITGGDPLTAVVGFSASNFKNKVLGSTLASAGVTNEAAITLGVNPTTDRSYLATIDGDDVWVTLGLKAIGVIGDAYTWRIRRDQLEASGRTINNIYCYITDARGLTGDSIGPIVATLGSLQPTRTKTVGSQLTEGAEFRLRLTGKTTTSDPWFYALPKGYDPRKPTPVVLWAPQSVTGAAYDFIEETRVQPVTQALLDAGYIVAGLTHTPDGYGNQALLDSYLDLYKHLRDSYNTGPLFWYGASMGGLLMANAVARRDFPTPAAVACVGGAFNLRFVYDISAFYAGQVTLAYPTVNGSGTNLETVVAGYDPIQRDGSEFRGVPWRFYTSAGDTSQPPAGQEAFAAKVLPHAPEATVVYGSGAHLDASQYQASDVLSFFQRYV